MDARQQARRRLIGTGLAGGLGLAVAGGLVVRNQIRHPHKNKRASADGRSRRLLLAVPSPLRDPVLLAAADQGIFERYQLRIEFAHAVDTGRDALDRVQAGQADGAVAAALSWLPRLRAGESQAGELQAGSDPQPGAGQPGAGLDARLVCGMQAGSARLLLARRSPVHRIEDLHRRTIGIASLDSPDRLFFSIMMRRKGMDPNRDVAWRAIPAEALAVALVEGQVQAVVGHDPAIWQLREAQHLPELASSMSGSYGARVSRVLGLRNQLLHDDPEAAVAVALAIQEAAAWVEKHPEQVSVLLAAQNPELTVEQAARMLKAEGHNVHPTGTNLRNQIAQYVDELKLLGLTPETVDSTAFAKRVTANVLKG